MSIPKIYYQNNTWLEGGGVIYRRILSEFYVYSRVSKGKKNVQPDRFGPTEYQSELNRLSFPPVFYITEQCCT